MEGHVSHMYCFLLCFLHKIVVNQIRKKEKLERTHKDLCGFDSIVCLHWEQHLKLSISQIRVTHKCIYNNLRYNQLTKIPLYHVSYFIPTKK